MNLPGAGVIFDVDGTLVDSNYLHVMAWSRVLTGAGHEVVMSDVHRLIGKGSDDLVEGLIGEVSDDDLADLLDAHGEALDELAGELRAMPGATDLLHAVSERGLLVALASSAKPDDHERNLEVLDAKDVVDYSTQSGDVDNAKPSPEIFQLALEQTDLDPTCAVVVGDTKWDMIAATRAGVRAIGLTCGGISEAELRAAGAAEVFDGPQQLADRLSVSLIGELPVPSADG